MTDAKNVAVAYYTALGEKKVEIIQNYFHPEIQFTDPQETILGKDAVLKAASGFMNAFKALTIRAKFGSEDQAMIVYDVEILGLTKALRAASLLRFREGLISHIELFYDSKSLVERS